MAILKDCQGIEVATFDPFFAQYERTALSVCIKSQS